MSSFSSDLCVICLVSLDSCSAEIIHIWLPFNLKVGSILQKKPATLVKSSECSTRAYSSSKPITLISAVLGAVHLITAHVHWTTTNLSYYHQCTTSTRSASPQLVSCDCHRLQLLKRTFKDSLIIHKTTSFCICALHINTLPKHYWGKPEQPPHLIMTTAPMHGIMLSMHHLPLICHTLVPEIRVRPEMLHVFQYINVLMCMIYNSTECCLPWRLIIDKDNEIWTNAQTHGISAYWDSGAWQLANVPVCWNQKQPIGWL